VEYERIVEEPEELVDIRAYDVAVAELERGEDELIPSTKRLERSRKGGSRKTTTDPYRVLIERKAQKQLDKIRQENRERIIGRVRTRR
jgi:hypothetical protein